MKTLIHKLLSGFAVTGGVPNPFTTASVVTQRIRDELGRLQVSGQSGWGAATTGFVNYQARLRPDQPFANVYNNAGVQTRANAALFVGLGNSFGSSALPILPEVRFTSTDLTPQNSILIDLWLIT